MKTLLLIGLVLCSALVAAGCGSRPGERGTRFGEDPTSVALPDPDAPPAPPAVLVPGPILLPGPETETPPAVILPRPPEGTPPAPPSVELLR